jgi:hypothetical protein
LLTLCARDWRKLERQARFRVEYGASRQALQPSARTHVYEVRPRKDRRGFDRMSDVLPFGRLWCDGTNAIGYAMHYSRSHDAVIRVYDEAGNVIETHEHKGEFKEW